MKYLITLSESFKFLFPDFKGAALYAEVRNSETPEQLKNEINQLSYTLHQQYTTQSIKERSGIAATRQAYKRIGKDPSRYRPACEQLARRIIQGKGLYTVNTIVDIINYASLYSGYSTAALDATQIIGNHITVDFGKSDELYEAIGRGRLNIENLPIYRDDIGGFATPTSDSTRTMININSTKLLVLINAYDGNTEHLNKTLEVTLNLLKKYAYSEKSEYIYY